MTTLERLCNNGNALVPFPWAVGKVKAFYYADGTPACFCMVNGTTKTKTEIGCEFFNHELKELNLNDGEEIATFLSTYGMFEHAYVKPFQRRSDLALKLCVYASFGLCETPPHFKPLKHGEVDEALTWRLKQLGYSESDTGFKGAVRNVLSEYDYALVGLPTLADLGLEESTLIQYEGVCRAVDFFLTCRIVYAAMLESTDVESVAAKLNMEPRELVETITDLDTEINLLMKNYSPEIGWVLNGAPNFGLIHKIKPEKCDTDLGLSLYGSEIRSFKPGSLSQAIALQLREFTLAKDTWRRCDKCHQIFVTRRNDDAKQKSRSSAHTCCTRCRRNLSQDTYRKKHAVDKNK